MNSIKYRCLKDRIFFVAICFLSSLTAIPLVMIIWELVKKGYKQINLSFLPKIAAT